ncbi:major capsid protein [Deinococcus aquaticus]|uniref:Phage major capsid protein n=1 Tax=Deinococcus aquaticus TaxID=328692 RepID=A0ABY7V2P4_9DEIO|nr:hypothetical protein [Deinococcus aquaticus]WDA58162.1 hypothetical protein M8445_12505 [Deinococcus aquaticus]
MALTLIEAQKLVQDEVQSGVIYNTYIQNPLLGLLPFENITGTATVYVRDSGLAAGSTTRAINADYVEGTQAFTRLTASLGRLGGKAQVDNFLEVTGSNVTDQLAAQIASKARSTAIAFQDQFFNGDVTVDANGFDGLKKLLTATSQDMTAATVITLDDVDSALLAIEGDASAIFVNDKTLAKLNGLARASGLVKYNDIDLVGSRVSSYAGIPLIRAGRNAAGQILADGEIYAVRFGVDGVHGIQANTPTVKVISPDDNATAPVWTARIDWYAGLAQKTLTSAVRLKRTL